MPRRRGVVRAAAVALAIGLAAPATTAQSIDAGGDAARMACAPGQPSPRPRTLRLHLIDRAGLSPDVLAELRRAARAPWLDAGLHLTWIDDAPLTRSDPREGALLYVIVAGDDGPAALVTSPGHRPISSIRFVDGSPTTHVVADAATVRSLLAAARLEDQPFAERPRLQRDRVTGRVLGRAIAHEIGHFVFASPAHAPVGLMRAAHRLEHLMSASHPTFRVVVPALPTCRLTRATPEFTR